MPGDVQGRAGLIHRIRTVGFKTGASGPERHARGVLTEIATTPLPSGVGLRLAVVAAEYNPRFVNGLLEGALETLQSAETPAPEVIRVPGSWEIPVAVAALTRRTRGRPDAVICLGVLWQGQTEHAHHVGEAVSDALMRLAVESGVPVIHGVLTVGTEEQAVARCLPGPTHRGVEAARTALVMATLQRSW